MPPNKQGRGKQRPRGHPNPNYPRDRAAVTTEESSLVYPYMPPGNFTSLYQPQSEGSNMSTVQFKPQQSTSVVSDEEPLVFSSDVGAALQQDSADIEKLRRLKETILAGQHPFFRAIPQPDALASLYLGPHPASLPPKDYSESHFNGPNVDEMTVSPVQSHNRVVRAPVYPPEEPAPVGNSRAAHAAISSQAQNLVPSLNLPRALGPQTPQPMPPNALSASGLQHRTSGNGSVSDSHADTRSGRPSVSIPPATTPPSPLSSEGPKSNTTLLPQPQNPGSVQMQPSSAFGPNADQNPVLTRSRTFPLASQDDSANASADKIQPQPIVNDVKDSASFREAHNPVSPVGYDRERERSIYPSHDASKFETPRHPLSDRRDPGRYGPRHPDTRYDRDRDWARGRDWEADRERERERDRDRERERLRDRVEFDRSVRPPPPLGDRRPPPPPSGDANVEMKSIVSLEPRPALGTRPPPPEQRHSDPSPSMEHRRTDVSSHPEQRRPEAQHAEQRRQEILVRVGHGRLPEGPSHPELRRSEVLPHPEQRPVELSYTENSLEMPPPHIEQRRTESTQHSEQQRRPDGVSHREQIRPDTPQHDRRRPDIPLQHDQRRREVFHRPDQRRPEIIGSQRMDTDVHGPPTSQSETQNAETIQQLESESHDASARRHPEPPASRPPPSSTAEQRRPESSNMVYPQRSPLDRDRFRVPQGAPALRSGPPNATVPESPQRDNRLVSVSSATAADERSTDHLSQPDQHHRPSSVAPALRAGPSTSEEHPDGAVKSANRSSVRPPPGPPGDNNAPRPGPPDRHGPLSPLDHVPRPSVSAENRPGAASGLDSGGHDEREVPRSYYAGNAPPHSIAGAPRPPVVSSRRPVDYAYEAPRDRRPSSSAIPYRDGPPSAGGPPRGFPEDSRRQSLDSNLPRRTGEGFYQPHPPHALKPNPVERRDEIRQWREREGYPPSYPGPEVNRVRDRSTDRPRGKFPDNPTHIHPPRARPPPPPAVHNHPSWVPRTIEIEKDKDREVYDPWPDRKFPPRGPLPSPPPPARWEEPPHAHKGRVTDTYDDRFIPRDVAERGRYPPPTPPLDVPVREPYRENPRVRPRSPSPTGRPAGVYDDAHRAPKRARDEYDAPPPPPGRPAYFEESHHKPPTEFGIGVRVASPAYYDPRTQGINGPRDPSLYGRDRAPDPYVRRDMPPPRSPPFYPRERYPSR